MMNRKREGIFGYVVRQPCLTLIINEFLEYCTVF